ncbi:hypothetical protein LTR62_005949 [Meristemomyces frigidus]|uniref:Elongator complex protein 4 n=1 Tax=Meristemomyces frigidus TaxID=1508187 RepID=A0AAN7YJX0_9PEZI|nr:hypothetical protein LTR62_005949 [Meristemomyces frigidus]
MAFRKRNVPIGSSVNSVIQPEQLTPPQGTRPSPLTLHPVTSTGTPSLDEILGGHSGLPLGSSLLIEENGTTDFAGVLLRFYAAEGICHGHILHVIGAGEGWVRELPGVADEKSSRKSAGGSGGESEKMKIAWRYESLGQAGERVHRIIIPAILSPTIWPQCASQPANFNRFLHALRALLRQHANRVTAIMTLPLVLYPRTSGLIRWAELLADGVLELTPFPHLMDASNNASDTGGSKEDQPQGMLKVHKLPITTERGEGGAGAGNTLGDDLAFTVSRRKFVIKPFSLPPLEGDQDAQKEAGQLTSKDVEF